MDSKNNIEQLIASCIHETWIDIMNWILEIGKTTFCGEEVLITLPKYKVNQWLHQMDKYYESLSKPEQASDVRNAQRIIKTLDKHGYMIVKKPNMKRPVYITQKDIDNLKEPK